MARAMRLILGGVVDREGVEGLARQIGYSSRQLNRVLMRELGAGALQLARTHRTQTARALLETTALPVTEVAFAAGFASIRQFNHAVKKVFALTPTEIRRRQTTGTPSDAGAITLRLPYRQPFDFAATLAFLAYRAVPGVERVDGGTYARVLMLPGGPGTVRISCPQPEAGYVTCELKLTSLKDVIPAVQGVRRLFDLDADPASIAEHLGHDAVLGPLVPRSPGRRLPGTVDAGELAVRAILGQQISVAAARTLSGTIVELCGAPLLHSRHGLTHAFPSPPRIAALDPAALPMPRSRAEALVRLSAAIAEGTVRLDEGADPDEAERILLALKGIGRWTADYIRLRGFADPDAFLPGDLGVRRALEGLGQPGEPAAAVRLAENWRPYRGYAVVHLWASLAAPVPT